MCVLETVCCGVFRRGLAVCVLETVCCGVFRRGSGVCVLETVSCGVFRRGSGVCVLETVCCGVFRRGSGVCVLETVSCGVFRRGSGVCVLETVCCGVLRRGSGVCWRSVGCFPCWLSVCEEATETVTSLENTSHPHLKTLFTLQARGGRYGKNIISGIYLKFHDSVHQHHTPSVVCDADAQNRLWSQRCVMLMHRTGSGLRGV